MIFVFVIWLSFLNFFYELISRMLRGKNTCFDVKARKVAREKAVNENCTLLAEYKISPTSPGKGEMIYFVCPF